MTSTSTSAAVNTKYSSIANSNTPADYSARVAASFGYEPSQLADLPPNTNLGLSCGNPLATANLSPADVVIDLGSGGGLDCMIAANSMVKAAKQTGQPLTGKVCGIDASKDMVDLATRNAKRANLPSRDVPHANGDPPDVAKGSDGDLISYIKSDITSIPLADSTATLIISNCVLNLVDDPLKPMAFREIHRLLQPGGRVAISDILAKKPLPDSMRQNVALVVGCVAGAASKEEYEAWMAEAGFDMAKVVVRATGKDINVYKDFNDVDGVGCCGAGEVKKAKSCCGEGSADSSDSEKLFAEDVRDVDFNEWVGAYEIYAVK